MNAPNPDQSPPWRLAADQLQAAFGPAPAWAVLLGSGMGPVFDRLQDVQGERPYEALGLPATGIAGHAGRLKVGAFGPTRVALLAGRVHGYEGRSAEETLRTVRALAAWGVKTLLLTSAVGGIRTAWPPGSLVRVTDHINFMGRNFLWGPNEEALGTRFPDLSRAYDPELGATMDRCAARLGQTLYNGVYAATSGPSYETPAEIRMLGMVGADVVGMSLVPDVLAGVHAGLRVGAIAVVSNLAAGLSPEALTHEDVQRVVGGAAARLGDLVSAVVNEC